MEETAASTAESLVIEQKNVQNPLVLLETVGSSPLVRQVRVAMADARQAPVALEVVRQAPEATEDDLQAPEVMEDVLHEATCHELVTEDVLQAPEVTEDDLHLSPEVMEEVQEITEDARQVPEVTEEVREVTEDARQVPEVMEDVRQVPEGMEEVLLSEAAVLAPWAAEAITIAVLRRLHEENEKTTVLEAFFIVLLNLTYHFLLLSISWLIETIKLIKLGSNDF